jgi:hypothetical protein
MTKQYIQNNTIFVVEYDEFMSDEHIHGYKLQQKDPTILWSHIMRILPARIQGYGKNANAIQKIVNKFYDQTECGWEEYLDRLVKDGELQDVPKTFCR